MLISFFVGAGGGKFKASEKPLKEVVYNSITDSAEGLYCALTNNGECSKYYQEREYHRKKAKEKDKRLILLKIRLIFK